MQVEPAAIAMSGLTHDSLIFEAEALVQVACAGVVLEDVEEETMGAQLAETDPNDLGEDASAEAAFRYPDDDSLQFDRAGVLAESAEDDVSVDAAAGVAYVVAGVAAGQRGFVALRAPLSDELTGYRIALESDDGGDVGGSRNAEEHGNSKIVSAAASLISTWRHESPVPYVSPT